MNRLALIGAGIGLGVSLTLTPSAKLKPDPGKLTTKLPPIVHVEQDTVSTPSSLKNQTLKHQEPLVESTVDSTVDFTAEVTPVDPRIEINIPAYNLRYYEYEKIVFEAKVCVGSMKYKTPLLKRTIGKIVHNPWWFPPRWRAWARGKEITPPGPDNPLGVVKIQIGHTPYFIHGTISERSIGNAWSHGCVRLHNKDADSLTTLIERQKENGETVMCKIIYDISDIFCLSEEEGFYVVRVYPDIYREKPNRYRSVIKDFEALGFELTEEEKRLIKAKTIWEGLMFFYYDGENGLRYSGCYTNWRLLNKINISSL